MKHLLAVSGGIDSMCMADKTVRSGIECGIVHCNFHLRGKDSDEDEALVRKWADDHGIRFHLLEFDTSGYASEKGISIEMAARELRYKGFVDIAAKYGYDVIAVAHNANDNAETLILNILRGTGSRGLRGMSGEGPVPCSETCNKLRLVRPLLGLSRKDIEEYVRSNKVPFREDRTNLENTYKRNRIRNKVFPEFERINPSFVRTLNEDISRFCQIDEIAEDYYKAALGSIVSGPDIDIKGLLGFKHWRYLLFRVLEEYGFNSETIDSAAAFVDGYSSGQTSCGKQFLAPKYALESTSGKLRIVSRDGGTTAFAPVTVQMEGTYTIGGSRLLVESGDITPDMDLKVPRGTLIMDADALGFPFAFRQWQAGDWLKPFGMGGRRKKLSDLFNDLGMSRSQKAEAVIIDSPGMEKGHIAALAGYRMDESLRIKNCSRHFVRITLSRCDREST